MKENWNPVVICNVVLKTILLQKRSRQNINQVYCYGLWFHTSNFFGQLQWATYLAANIKWHLRFKSSFLANRNAIKATILLQLHANFADQRCSKKTPLLITAWIIIHFTLLTNFVQYLLQCNDKNFPSMGKKVTKNCNETTLCIAVQFTAPRVKLFKVLAFGVWVEVSSSCLRLH